MPNEHECARPIAYAGADSGGKEPVLKKLIKNVLALAFIGYMLLLLYFLFFSEEYGRTTRYTEYQYNFTLFRELSRYIKYREVVGVDYFLINVVGNVVMFMPFGFFVLSLSKKKRKGFFVFFSVTVSGFLFSLSVETIQLLTKVGCFDVDDLLLNTIGVVLGYWMYRFCRAIWQKGHEKRAHNKNGRKE